MKNEKYTDLRPCAVGEGMPLPAMHLQPVQTAVKMANAPDLSLRGGHRPTWRPEREARGSALGVQSREGSHDFADSLPGIRLSSARLPRRFAPRNDTSGEREVHQRPPTVELLPTGRSLSAATGPVGGGCHLNDSLCESFVHHRERHAAPLQWRVRSIPPIIHGGPGGSSRAAVYDWGY